jgi:hypothetical protein
MEARVIDGIETRPSDLVQSHCTLYVAFGDRGFVTVTQHAPQRLKCSFYPSQRQPDIVRTTQDNALMCSAISYRPV